MKIGKAGLVRVLITGFDVNGKVKKGQSSSTNLYDTTPAEVKEVVLKAITEKMEQDARKA